MTMSADGGNTVITSRRVRKLKERARRAQRAGKHVAVITLRDHPGGPLGVLLVSEPGEPSPAYSYFPQRDAD